LRGGIPNKIVLFAKNKKSPQIFGLATLLTHLKLSKIASTRLSLIPIIKFRRDSHSKLAKEIPKPSENLQTTPTSHFNCKELRIKRVLSPSPAPLATALLPLLT